MLTLHHDVPSAASLLAVLRLERLFADVQAVRFAGFDSVGLGATIPATLADVEEWDRHRVALADLGWDVGRPRLHPATLPCHLIEIEATSAGRGSAWRHATYRAHWFDGRDLGDESVLVDLADDVGMDPAVVRALLDDRPRATALRQEMIRRRGNGVGGVPVLEVNGTYTSPFIADDDLRTLAAL